jgi:4-hydroxy-tetrahydrodipicolinate synthase
LSPLARWPRIFSAVDQNMKAPLTGIIPPMVTPLRDRDQLDVAGLERLVEHILAGGVNGLFILGTTGEGPSLSYRLRRELVERVCRPGAGRHHRHGLH